MSQEVEKELEPLLVLHSRTSLYREVLREAYKSIVTKGADIVDSLAPIVTHVLFTTVFNSREKREEFAKLLKQRLIKELEIDEATANEVVAEFIDKASIAKLVEAIRESEMRRARKERSIIDPGIISAYAERKAREIIVRVAETFLVDIGIV